MAGKNSRSGFTLIEMMVVVTIIGFVVAVTAIRIFSPLREIQAQNLIERTIELDQFARHHANKRKQPVRILFDRRQQTIRLATSDGKELSANPIAFGGSIRLEALYLVVDQTIDHNAKQIVIDRRGQSASFAFRFQQNDRSRWLFCSGLTGQFLELGEEEDAKETLQTLTQGADFG